MTISVALFAIVVALILALLGAVLFIVFCAGVALIFLLPTLFVTIAVATFIWLWGVGGYYILKYFNEKPIPGIHTDLKEGLKEQSGWNAAGQGKESMGAITGEGGPQGDPNGAGGDDGDDEAEGKKEGHPPKLEKKGGNKGGQNGHLPDPKKAADVGQHAGKVQNAAGDAAGHAGKAKDAASGATGTVTGAAGGVKGAVPGV